MTVDAGPAGFAAASAAPPAASASASPPPRRARPLSLCIPLPVRPPSSAPTQRSSALLRSSVGSINSLGSISSIGSSTRSGARRRRTFISPPPPLRLLQSAEPPADTAFTLRPLRLSRQVHDYDEIARLRADGLAARDARQQRRTQLQTAAPGAAAGAAQHLLLDSPRYVAEGDFEMRAMLLAPLVRAENALLDQKEEWKRRHRMDSLGRRHSHRQSLSHSLSHSLNHGDSDDDGGDDSGPLADPAISMAAAALANRKKETELALQSVQLGGSSSSRSPPAAITTRKPRPPPQPHFQPLPQPPLSPIRQPPAAVFNRPAPPPTPPLSPQRRAHDKDVPSMGRDQGTKRDSSWRNSIQSVISWRGGPQT